MIEIWMGYRDGNLEVGLKFFLFYTTTNREIAYAVEGGTGIILCP